MPAPQPLTTAYTISIGTPETMAEAARAASQRTLLKIKLGGAGDPERIAAVRRAAPQSELIVDANEGWTADNLADNLAACADAGVTLIEQPLPADDDAALADVKRPIAVCADESVHDRASLAALAGRYDAVNIKLDKTGGLTEALAMAAEAERLGFRHHGRLHGRDLARDGAGHAARAARAAWSISTARCCWRRTARTGYATKEAWFTRRRPDCGDDDDIQTCADPRACRKLLSFRSRRWPTSIRRARSR